MKKMSPICAVGNQSRFFPVCKLFAIGRALSVALEVILLVASSHGATLKIASVKEGKTVPTYSPGEIVIWDVNVTSVGVGDGSEILLEWKAVSWSGREITGQTKATLQGSKAVLRMECIPPLSGWYDVGILVSGGGAPKANDSKTFVVGETVKSAGKTFRYGVSTHTVSCGAPDMYREIELLHRLGVDIVRDDLKWGRVEPQKGDWKFEQIDLYLERLERAGIELQAILCYTARWASTGNPNAKNWHEWNNAAPQMEPWLNYVRTIVERYKGRVRSWEVWNEEDIGAWLSSTEKYTELFDNTSRLVMDVNPQAQVLNGGFSGTPRLPNPDFMKKFSLAADKTFWAVWAYHDYHTFSELLSRNDEQLELYKQANMTIPVWINEGGFHCLNVGGERKQAVTLVKKYASCPALHLPVKGYFWYDLRDDGSDPNDKEHHFGLVRRNYDPKPAYAAYQNVIRELAPCRFERKLEDKESPSGVWALLYRHSEDESVLVAWREGGENQETPVWLGAGERGVIGVSDIMGNPMPTGPAPGGIFLKLGNEPVFVKLQGNAPKLRSVLEINPVVVLPGRASDVRMTVTNPFSNPAEAKLSAQSDMDSLEWQPSNEMIVSLAPKEKKEISLRALLPDKAASGLDWRQTHKVEINLDLNDSGKPLQAQASVQLGLAIPKLATSTAAGSFPKLETSNALKLDLQGRDFIRNLFSAEVNPVMQWGGDDDLSATGWLAYDDSTLYLQVEARDNIHRQNDIGLEMWKADSLQVGIVLDDSRPDSFIELGVAQNEEGKTGGWIFATSKRTALPLGHLNGPAWKNATRENGHTLYQLALPWKTLGFHNGAPKNAFRLNFIVNDDDGHGRKQWVQLTPGLGNEKAPSFFHLFMCR
ncbi:MAG: endo-1,4-beta-xylanase [Chthoniobacteraceae bacterium]